jgi:DNA polymerase I
MKTLILVDGHAILHRAYHAYPHLTTSQGELINAVYGFTSIILSALNQFEPDYVAVAFDKKAPTFRHKEFKEYKAHRPETDKELVDQIPRVYEVVKSLNIPIFAKNGYEADDIIGTIARQAERSKNLEVVIITGDKDALQLLDDQVKVFMPGRGKIPSKMYDQKLFKEKYEFDPIYLIDFKALAGDPSDGIPGVRGIGPKTAQKLIKKYQLVEKVYEHLGKADLKPNMLSKLKSSKKLAMLSKKLATIETKAPIKLDLQKCCLLDYDKDKVKSLFEKLEFTSLISKLPGKNNDENNKAAKNEKKDNNNQMELF